MLRERNMKDGMVCQVECSDKKLYSSQVLAIGEWLILCVLECFRALHICMSTRYILGAVVFHISLCLWCWTVHVGTKVELKRDRHRLDMGRRKREVVKKRRRKRGEVFVLLQRYGYIICACTVPLSLTLIEKAPSADRGRRFPTWGFHTTTERGIYMYYMETSFTIMHVHI